MPTKTDSLTVQCGTCKTKRQVLSGRPPLCECGQTMEIAHAEIWTTQEPTDRLVWGVCSYFRQGRACLFCPKWEDDPEHGRTQRGCRATVEEICRMVAAEMEGRP